MKYEEKLDLIVSEIVEARKRTRIGQPAKIFVAKQSELAKKLILQEVHDILLKLQDDEKIIEIKDLPRELKSVLEIKIDDNQNYFLVTVSDNFDNWYSTYKIKQKSTIENLSKTNFDNVYFILLQIQDQFQLAQSEKFSFSLVTSIHEIQGYESDDIDELTNGCINVLEYLKKIGVLKEYSHAEMSLDANIVLDINKYLDVLEVAKKIKGVKENVEPTNPTIPTKTNEKSPLSYDPKKGVLNVEGKPVKLNKDSFRAKILELLLSSVQNRKKEWSWDEVIEKIQGVDDIDTQKENKSKFYPACDGLSKHIASKTGVTDLLIYNKSTVQINPKYL